MIKHSRRSIEGEKIRYDFSSKNVDFTTEEVISTQQFFYDLMCVSILGENAIFVAEVLYTHTCKLKNAIVLPTPKLPFKFFLFPQ